MRLDLAICAMVFVFCVMCLTYMYLPDNTKSKAKETICSSCDCDLNKYPVECTKLIIARMELMEARFNKEVVHRAKFNKELLHEN